MAFTLSIKHTLGKYPITIGEQDLSDPTRLQSFIAGEQAMIVTDENVAKHYLSSVQKSLQNTQYHTIILPPGEEQKTFSTYERIINTLAKKKHHRDTTLIALGGGVIGDLTGFAAASYQRGVSYIQIPTTLLAQVDASIGGKTAINHPAGKNLIGAFHHPKAVIINTNTLQTLSDREYRSGIAEIIKMALIHDAAFFEWLEENHKKLLARDQTALHTAIKQSCAIKQYYVTQDEKEQGVRALLNLGHTFGHAIEKELQFKSWLHGEAVAYGILMAALLSCTLNLLSDTDYCRIKNLLQHTDLLKVLPSHLSLDQLTKTMQSDKKVRHGCLRLILLTGIGNAVITKEVSNKMIRESWEQI